MTRGEGVVRGAIFAATGDGWINGVGRTRSNRLLENYKQYIVRVSSFASMQNTTSSADMPSDPLTMSIPYQIYVGEPRIWSPLNSFVATPSRLYQVLYII